VSGAGRTRPGKSSGLETSAIREPDALEGLRKEWAGLHRDAAPGSPFEHPAWAEVWAKHYVPPGDLECVAIRDTAQDGLLVGFAPLYRRHHSVAGLRATCIRPLGTGGQEELTEVVQVLVLPGHTSNAVRALVGHLEALEGWNWAQFSLGPDQGWLVPQWLDDPANSMVKLRNTKACVVFDDLPADVDNLMSRLKRNVRESIRRSRNRSAKLGGMTFRCAQDVGDVKTAVAKLIELHRKRAQMPGKIEHANKFGSTEIAFLLEAVENLAQYDLARVHLAEHNGEPVAALLVLSDGRTDYISATGLDPRYWELSLNTMLIFQALTEAVSRGRSSLNLSTGPDLAKLRWSSTVAAFHDFVIVRSDRKSRWVYGAFAHASLAMENMRETRLHRVTDGG
jgi:CelD/BcsL family acetyltransferase involved in cellulose biosynthesis